MSWKLARDIMAGPAWLIIAWWAASFLVGIINHGGHVHPVVFMLPLLAFMFGIMCIGHLLFNPPTGKDGSMTSVELKMEYKKLALRQAKLHKQLTQWQYQYDQMCEKSSALWARWNTAVDEEQEAILNEAKAELAAAEPSVGFAKVLSDGMKAARAAVPEALQQEADACVAVPLSPDEFAPMADADPDHDFRVGPWLTAIECDGIWDTPRITTEWADVHRSAASLTAVQATRAHLVVFPLRWLKALPEMLVQLSQCRTLLDRIEPKTAPPFCDDISKQMDAICAVIAKASPPAEGGEG